MSRTDKAVCAMGAKRWAISTPNLMGEAGRLVRYLHISRHSRQPKQVKGDWTV